MRKKLLFFIVFLIMVDTVNAGELHIAAVNDDVGAIKRLVTGDADINKLDSDPKSSHSHPIGTPLHWAARHGAVEAVQVLVGLGADVNAKEYYGECAMVSTPLDYAVGSKNFKITEILLKAGANPQGADHPFFWPLQIAAEDENLEIIALLLKHGASHKKVGVDGYTALHHAIRKQKLKSITFLIQNGADPDFVPDFPSAQTAREYAKSEKNEKAVKVMEHFYPKKNFN